VHIFGNVFVTDCVYTQQSTNLKPVGMVEDYRKWEKRVRNLSPGRHLRYTLLATVVVVMIVAFIGSYRFLRSPVVKTTFGLTKFSSESEFRSYLLSSSWLLNYLPRTFTASFSVRDVGLEGGLAAIPERISTTNVQVAGIDEPDIVKTDGVNIYFSPPPLFYVWWIPGFRAEFPEFQYPQTHIVRAFPPENISVISKIDKTGDMLLVDNVLVIFSGSEITGYDVSNPDSPVETWSIEVNGSIIAARLYRGVIYLVTQTFVYSDIDFPLTLIRTENEAVTIGVSEIYRPVERIPVDALFTAATLDPMQGKITNKLSFVGSSGTSIVYMSQNALYITYTYYPSPLETYHRFIKEKCGDILSSDDMLRIDKLIALEISEEAKLFELETILEPYLKEISARAENYFAERARDLQLTGIIKVDLESFGIVAQGRVPGYPLNQFSLDEFNGYLRLATTIEPFIWMFGSVQSANDVYILDGELKVVGSVKDLGLTERIYSVRFIGEKGYIVTFRETDPFYVLDLSDPANPRLTGELKIPGYSSYLHPITENLILGIGRENLNVKISLFDVSESSQPVELDKTILDEYWSDVLETHHAFLLDPDHKVFFLPAGQNGYVFSYENAKISQVLKTEISEISRAVYLDDFLYLIGSRGIVVFDENTWQKVSEVAFE